MRIYDLSCFYKYPSKEEIEELCRSYDYNNYIPFNIFIDLLTLLITNQLNTELKIDLNTVNASVKDEFFKSLDLSLFKKDTPLHQAMKLLIYLNKSYNLRSLELESIVEPGDHLNLREELNEEETKELLTILPKDINNEDVAKILNLSFFIINNSVNNSIKDTYENLKSVKDIFKLNKSKWIRHDFIEKVIKREHIVIVEEEHQTSEETIIYLEDNTYSMTNSLNLIVACRYALLKLNKKVLFYTFDFGLNEAVLLDSKEKLLKYFSEPIKFRQSNCNYYKVFQKVSNLHSKGTALLVTDAEDFVPANLKAGIVINCVTNVNNPTMQKFININKGKYIKI